MSAPKHKEIAVERPQLALSCHGPRSLLPREIKELGKNTVSASYGLIEADNATFTNGYAGKNTVKQAHVADGIIVNGGNALRDTATNAVEANSKPPNSKEIVRCNSTTYVQSTIWFATTHIKSANHCKMCEILRQNRRLPPFPYSHSIIQNLITH